MESFSRGELPPEAGRPTPGKAFAFDDGELVASLAGSIRNRITDFVGAEIWSWTDADVLKKVSNLPADPRPLAALLIDITQRLRNL